MMMMVMMMMLTVSVEGDPDFFNKPQSHFSTCLKF